ncbi:MAG: ABC transporter permease, partial [Gemmatimonadetes bacterium]|nr:ABC transporter permease [Gemmatimonadota bacterium]
MPTLFRNSALAFRRLRRAPLFFAVSVGTLAIGIGGNTAIFSVVHALLLEPLPYAEPDQLVRVYEVGRTGSPMTFSAPNYHDIRTGASSFTDVAVIDGTSFTLTESGPPERVTGQRVTPAFFSILGVQPLLGRTLREEDARPGADRVAIVAEGLWRTRFGGRPDLVGQEIRLNGEAYRVVGVMPGDFGYPDQTARIWTPAVLTAEDLTENRGAHYFDAIGRLRPGASVEAARVEVEAIAARLAAEYPDTNAGYSMTVVPLHEDLVGDYRPALLVLLGAVALVLLIACVNVANLFLVRALDRRRELAVRTAIGAGRGRLAGEVMVESLLVSLLGGAAGLLVAALGTDVLVALQAEDVPRLAGVGINGTVLLFTLLVSALVGLAFGLVPAWRAGRQAGLSEELKDGRGRMERPEHVRLRSTLVVAQVVLAVILLGGAGLLGRSFMKLTRVDHGFRTENVLTFDISLPDAAYPTHADARQFFDRLMPEIRAVPG